MDFHVWAKKFSKKKNVPVCNFYREMGLYHKITGPPKYLQWAAEENLIHKNHEEFTCQLPDGTRSTFLMVFSPDGTMIASTHGNHNVYITYLTNGRNVKTLSGHPRTPWCIAFHPSSNQILASGCLGGQVRVWDLHGGSEIWVVESQTVIASLAFHPTDRVLVIASYNEVYFWDWSQDKPFAKCSTSNEREKVRYVSFDKLGHRLITGIANAPRLKSQWDRVSAPQPPPQIRQAEHERRITICYRYMVEQYEQLVQRYYSLSRLGNGEQRRNGNNRNAQPVTMDRGTDPMEPPPVRVETRCSFCRGDVNNSNQGGDGNSRVDDATRPSTSSSSSTPTCEVGPSSRTPTSNVRHASTQHRGTDEASASRSSSQFLNTSGAMSESVSDPSTGNALSNSLRRDVMLSTRDFNTTLRNNYLDRINRLRTQVERGRNILVRMRNTAAAMQASSSPSAPEDLQSLDDLFSFVPLPPPRLPVSPHLSVPSFLSNLETPISDDDHLTNLPPLPPEVPPLSPPPLPPLEDPPMSPLPPLPEVPPYIPSPPPPEEISIPSPVPPPPEEPPERPPPPPPPEEPSLSPPPGLPPIQPPTPVSIPITFNIFRLTSFLRGQRKSSIVNRNSGATTTTSENSTDSTENVSSGNARKDSAVNNKNNSNLSVDPKTTSSTVPSVTTPSSSTLLHPTAECQCPSGNISSSMGNQSIRDEPSSQETGESASTPSTSSANRQTKPRAFRDSGSNTENYESNSSDSTSGRVLRRNTESSSAIARLRAQFRRLQSAYNTRDRELMLLREAEERAERRLISRLTTLLERAPWINSNDSFLNYSNNDPATTTSSTSNTQPSSSSATTSAGTSTPIPNIFSPLQSSDMASVRCGLHLLTRHIDNLSSQFRMDLERGQANHIRRLWRDLHNQICALSLALRASATGPAVGPTPSSESTQQTPPSGRAEVSTSEASTSGTSSVTEEDDDESDVSPRNWFWLRRQSRRPRQQLRLAASYKRARIDVRFRMGRGGTSRLDNYSRVRFYDALLGPSDGSNDDDDDDEEGEGDEDQEATTENNTSGVHSGNNRASHNVTGTGTEGLPNRGIKRKNSRINVRPRDFFNTNNNQLLGSTPPPSTSTAAQDIPTRSSRPCARIRTFGSPFRSYRTANRHWHHPGNKSRAEWSRENHMTPSDPLGEGPSTSRQNNRDDSSHREAIRRRARHVLLLMVDSITQFFENDTFTTTGTNENLNERTSSLISLLELALELTDLLLTQLDSTRRRRPNYWQSRLCQEFLRARSEEDRRMRGWSVQRRQLSPVMMAMRQERLDRVISAYTRMLQSSGNNREEQNVRSNSQPASGSTTPPHPRSRLFGSSDRIPISSPPWSMMYDTPNTPPSNANSPSNNSSTHRTAEIRLPVLRVNDGPVPEDIPVIRPYQRPGANTNSPRGSSPPLFYPPLFRPRLLHPRYFGPYYFIDDNSTASEDSSQQENRSGSSSSLPRLPLDRYDRFDREFLFMRGHPPAAVLMTDSPMAPHHRIQAWDFTKFTLPEISNARKNIVVEECKIHNDASIDISYDGKILVTLLPSGRLSITTMLGVYSLEWDSLGQILYATSFDQNAVSVSLSPTTRHLIVGLASRRLHFFHTDRQTIAQIFRLEGGRPGCESELPSKGKLVLVRDLEISRESTDITSLNCIRWAPTPGEGFVYGTNSGKLKVLR